MKRIRCFNNMPCPHRGEYRGFDEVDKNTTTSPRAYYSCNAPSLEAMQPCIMDEDPDLKKYGFKVLVKGPDGVVRAWDPSKVVVQRLDREEAVSGEAFEV